MARADHRCGYCSSVVDSFCVAPASGALPIVQCPAPTMDVSDAQCYSKIVRKKPNEKLVLKLLSLLYDFTVLHRLEEQLLNAVALVPTPI